jgi:hypothetical protein
MMHVCEHGTPCPILVVLKLVNQYIYALLTPKLSNIPPSTNFFGLPCELHNWSHDHCKLLDKTFVKLCHAIEHLNLL